MQDKLLKMNYEEILIGLSDLVKTNFREILNIKGNEKFSFKERIKKYNHIKKSMMFFYQFEFHQMMEKIDEIWMKIHRKMKGKS